jgi:hypothetical protein
MSCDLGIYGINEESLSIAIMIASKTNGKVAVYDDEIQTIISNVRKYGPVLDVYEDIKTFIQV